MKSIEVKVFLKSGAFKSGFVNIEKHNRFTDYIEEEKPSHIRLYGGKPAFILIPVCNIDYYIPEEKEIKDA